MADLEFRRDLFRGTARYYDRFRVPYPQSLIDDLAERSQASISPRRSATPPLSDMAVNQSAARAQSSASNAQRSWSRQSPSISR